MRANQPPRPLQSYQPRSLRATTIVRSSVTTVSGVTELASKYHGVLLDQFGVLHDGREAYSPATIAAVKCLADAGVKTMIISNSSRRSSGTLKKLQALGFDPSWFVGAVTSGDLAHEYLLNRPTPWWRGLGSRCVHLTWGSRGTISLEGLNLEVTPNPDAADFILAHGTEAVGQGGSAPPLDASLDDIRALLTNCAARGLPLVVANPDLVTVDGPGRLAVMPGTFAAWYRDMGGQVQLMGKPAPVIYEAAMRTLGLEAGEVLAIGDSMEHDIAGAAAAGVDTLFVAGGIHANELGVQQGTPRGAACGGEGLKRLCTAFDCKPTYIINYLEP